MRMPSVAVARAMPRQTSTTAAKTFKVGYLPKASASMAIMTGIMTLEIWYRLRLFRTMYATYAAESGSTYTNTMMGWNVMMQIDCTSFLISAQN